MDIVSDTVIFPDKYNTGITSQPTKKAPNTFEVVSTSPNKLTRWNDVESEGAYISFGQETTTPAPAVGLGIRRGIIFGGSVPSGKIPVFENLDLRHIDGSSELVDYISFSANTDNVTIKFKNCILPNLRARYANYQVTSPREEIKVILEDCTVYDVCQVAMLEADHCQFISAGVDCINVLRDGIIKNCYAYNPGNIKPPNGMHCDILQTTPVKGNNGENLYIRNCHFENPATHLMSLPTTLPDGRLDYPLGGCLMGDLDYAHFSGIDIDALYVNGGTYSVYIVGGENETTKAYKLSGDIYGIYYGANCQSGGLMHYRVTNSENLNGVTTKIKPVQHPFIGSVRVDENRNKIMLYAANLENTAKTVRIVTNTGTNESKVIPKMPTGEESEAVSSPYLSIADYPVDYLLEIDKKSGDEYVQVYYGDQLIRTQLLADAGERPDIPEDDNPTTPPVDDDPETTDKQWAISDSLLTGLGDAFRDVGAEGKFTLAQMANMVRQFGSSAPTSSIEVIKGTGSNTDRVKGVTFTLESTPSGSLNDYAILVRPVSYDSSGVTSGTRKAGVQYYAESGTVYGAAISENNGAISNAPVSNSVCTLTGKTLEFDTGAWWFKGNYICYMLKVV